MQNNKSGGSGEKPFNERGSLIDDYYDRNPTSRDNYQKNLRKKTRRPKPDYSKHVKNIHDLYKGKGKRCKSFRHLPRSWSFVKFIPRRSSSGPKGRSTRGLWRITAKPPAARAAWGGPHDHQGGDPANLLRNISGTRADSTGRETETIWAHIPNTKGDMWIGNGRTFRITTLGR